MNGNPVVSRRFFPKDGRNRTAIRASIITIVTASPPSGPNSPPLVVAREASAVTVNNPVAAGNPLTEQPKICPSTKFHAVWSAAAPITLPVRRTNRPRKTPKRKTFRSESRVTPPFEACRNEKVRALSKTAGSQRIPRASEVISSPWISISSAAPWMT